MNSPTSPALPDALLSSGTRRPYREGETVFRSGSATHSIFFVVSGEVRLVRHGRAGEEVVLHRARRGEFIAEASRESSRYHCDAVVSEPGELLKIPSRALSERLSEDRAFAQQWEGLLARQLRAARSRVERLSLKSAAERVRHLLVSEGKGTGCEVVLDGTLKALAHDLGLTPEALYRTLAAMEREGIIERRGPSLKFVCQPRS